MRLYAHPGISTTGWHQLHPEEVIRHELDTHAYCGGRAGSGPFTRPYFGTFGLNHQIYLRKPNVVTDRNDDYVGEPESFLLDGRNHSSCDIRLLFFQFSLLSPWQKSTIVVTVGCLSLSITIARPRLKNMHSTRRPGCVKRLRAKNY